MSARTVLATAATIAIGLAACNAPGPEGATNIGPTSTPTSTSSPIEEIEDLEGYTCQALSDGASASKHAQLNAQFDAATKLDVAAGQWEESLPAVGQELRTISRGLRGGMTDRQVLTAIKKLADRSFPGCLSTEIEEPSPEPEPEPSPEPGADLRVVKRGRSAGDFATTIVTADIDNPSEIAVRVTADPAQGVDIFWSLICTRGFSAGSKDGQKAGQSPLFVQARFPFQNADNCIVSASGSLSNSGRLLVEILAD